MGMIAKSTIDAVYETARLEEVIGDYVQLKRSGTNLKGLSPFSAERTPSFMVSPVKQIWKDFSSGKGGNVIAFLMEHEHFSYPEAIRYLANKYNIPIEETETSDEEKKAQDQRESLYVVTEFAQKYFHQQLLDTDEGKSVGLSYFKSRGFTIETIKKFGLGYSPEQWDAFSREALGKGYQLDILEQVGFTINKDPRLIDRFRGRVMFPIHSMSGRVVGFGGRILNSEAKAAKYLNSPESEIYHKSKLLYGIYQAKQAIAKADVCYLVEGYTDVIQLNQAGIENVVASSGTALTPEQIRLISRLTQNIVVLFDGDAAGLRASVRGVDLILEAGLNVKVCTFPDGDDPDSFARKTPTDDLKAYLLREPKDFIQFKANLLMEEAQHDPIKKANLIHDMVGSIAKIPDRIKREIYAQEVSRIMDISEQVIANSLAQLITRNAVKGAEKQKGNPSLSTGEMAVVKEIDKEQVKVDVLYELERRLIAVLLLYGNREGLFEDVMLRNNEQGEVETFTENNSYPVYQRIFLSLQADEVELANPTFRAIYSDLIAQYNQHPEGFELDKFVQALTPELAAEVSDIIMSEERDVLHKWDSQNIFVKQKEDSITQYVTETILTLRWYLVNRLVDGLKQEVVANPQADSTEILSGVIDYTRLIQFFSVKLGRVLSRY